MEFSHVKRTQKTILSLDGKWSLQQRRESKPIPAHVPGDVYADLIRAKQMPDPFYRHNELDLQWIGETDWSYSRTFTITRSLLDQTHIRLRCDGLDTFATIILNGRKVAQADNMFRIWEWDIKEYLKPGTNSIQIDFKSVLPFIRKQSKAYPSWKGADYLAAYPGWVRKEQCNFGWDWGIRAVTCGIWRSISIVAFSQGRLTDVGVTQHHTKKRVTLHIDTTTEGRGKGLKVKVSVLDKNRVVAESTASIVKHKGKRSFSLENPKLWWPNNMGDQHLYSVMIDLLNRDGDVIDTMTKRIGLRTLVLDRHKDKWGESFQFVVNGVPFFSKGSNWIPVDAILGRRTHDEYHRLIKAAADCNMNMIRVWGGGIYEDDAFYSLCDELGICVWQDFMFACSAYPFFNKPFVKSITAETRDAIKRLRHHPCLALWCGNNELEMMNVGDGGWKDGHIPWTAYKKIFDDLLPAQVDLLSPEIPYWPSSPHSSIGDRSKHRNDICGDAHLWIITGNPPFECARGLKHRFASEFGFQSFPEPRTVRAFTKPSDRNIASRIMEHHQRAPGGNTTITQQMMKCLRMPSSFDNFLWASQIMQGTAVKNVCEHFRRHMPRCMGALYWQLNDCWPVASWASIDFHGRWKALQYMIRHAFAPVLISGVADTENGTVDIHVTSDRSMPLPGTVSWTVTDMDGNILDQDSKDIRTPKAGSRKIKTLTLAALIKQVGAHNILIWLDVNVRGEPRQRNLVWLVPPKHMDLSTKPGIKSTIKQHKDGSFSAQLSSKKVALWCWLEITRSDATLSDNFIHLRPGIQQTITVNPNRKTTKQQLRQNLTIRSLVNTY
jgi:beta-mannosidase